MTLQSHSRYRNRLVRFFIGLFCQLSGCVRTTDSKFSSLYAVVLTLMVILTMSTSFECCVTFPARANCQFVRAGS
ncbi:uncharacterized protein EDB91DRAFT_1102907 [Suillus paluster]|uniref:uncharacterized protein n=1 Tax=Suillus paluster TaxID=48578 RepID=UPI001B882873|nr:uncharacterized protein EDB91DRAFT_1102907 [Suillus paluster]KAG1752494.1 hypothetical protein EDB91DRAFT_1102907 [Suillus paluster]